MSPTTSKPENSQIETLRRRLLIAASGVGVFGLLHHTDHILRGNHVGYPVNDEINPFTFSLLVYPFLGLGIYLTLHRKAWPSYWLIYGLVVLGLVLNVHFVPLPGYEAPRDIYIPYINPYADPSVYSKAPAPEHLAWWQQVYGPHASLVYAVLALVILAILIISLVIMVVTAFQAWRISRRR